MSIVETHSEADIRDASRTALAAHSKSGFDFDAALEAALSAPRPTDYSYDQIRADAPEHPEFDVHTFKHPGAVAFRFAKSNAVVRAIMGPMGSGKTSEIIQEHLTRAMRMPINKRGRREYVGLIVRDTYRNLYKTTVPSWWSWFPPTWGKWEGGQDRPAVAKILFTDQYGDIHLTMHFAAIGDHNVEEFFKGFEPTNISFDEADQLPEEVIEYALGRIGRFPRARDFPNNKMPAFWRGIWMGLNPPPYDHWLYNRFVRDANLPLDEHQQKFLDEWQKEAGYRATSYYEFFKQPSGLSAEAENTANLPATYYLQMMGAKKWFIRRNVHGDFGYPRDGDPVYELEFDDDVHFSREPMKPVPGLPVDIAIDGAGHPAAVFSQKMPDGQRRYYREIVNQRGGVGPKRFSGQINDVLAETFPGFPIGECWGDPSMWYGSDDLMRELSEKSTAKKIISMTGIRFKPAPSNEISMRTDAVREGLETMIDGEYPQMIFDPSMTVTRAGFNYKYAYRKNSKTGELVDGQKPNKLPGVSDVHDCIQYEELGDRGLASVQARSYQKTRARDQAQERIRRKLRRNSQRQSSQGFSVWDR